MLDSKPSCVKGWAGYFVAVALLALALSACTHRLPTETVRQIGRIVVDTLDVAIVRDETPGFPYPRMRHDITFVGHLNVPGFIDQYEYQSRDLNFGVIFDYIGGFRPDPGYKFRFHQRLWSANLIEAGVKTGYVFRAFSPFARTLTVDAEVAVQSASDGPVPDPNSRQLTGPENRNFRPLFSGDGRWVYFEGWDAQDRISSLNRVPSMGGPVETIVASQEDIGGFALTENDSKLVYVTRQRNEPSDLVFRDLSTGAEQRIRLDGFLWDAPLVPIGDGRQFITLSDPNVLEHESDLLLIDAEKNTIETLVRQREVGRIGRYGYRPGTREISYEIRTDVNAWTIFLLDLDTRETTPFLTGLEGSEFVWAPNGRDYAFTRVVERNGTTSRNIFVNEGGIERQLTFYPGEDRDPNFSSDGRSLCFTSVRRGETQIWRIDF